MSGDLRPFQRSLLAWYDRARRDLPWRVVPGSDPSLAPDPYHVLVSEAMLQQTQVATVVPYYRRFLEQFPTAAALAAADEQAVLRAWQGLGYYSRARNLQRAAQRVVADHGGRLPDTVDGLLALPGVGRYTAGAVASIAFGRRAPILDGNVARVLCRLDAVTADPRLPATRELLWARAEQVLPHERLGDFNSALMELGATVCTPRSPQCLICPVQAHCQAVAAGIQNEIPPPKKAKPTPLIQRWTVCVRWPGDGDGGGADRYLFEQRPAAGRWAGMWQFTTFEPTADGVPTAAFLHDRLGLRCAEPTPMMTVEHGLTHRRYAFAVYRCDVAAPPAEPVDPRRWLAAAEVAAYPLPRPHLKVLEAVLAPPGRGKRPRA